MTAAVAAQQSSSWSIVCGVHVVNSSANIASIQFVRNLHNYMVPLVTVKLLTVTLC